MSREKFEADFKSASEKSNEEIRKNLAGGYQEEATKENAERDQLKTEIPADISAVEEKKKRIAEIEGKPESAIASKRERTAAEKEAIAGWEKFLKDCFPEEQFDLSALEVPERTPEEERKFTRLQFRSGSLSDETLFQKCKELFAAWKDTDESLDDVAVKKAVRDSFIWVRDNEEADEKHKNKSANMIDEEGLRTESLGDRFLHELKYFKETGKHLDNKTVTITSSRGADGCALLVHWFDDGMEVRRYDPGTRLDYWRPRQVVSSAEGGK